MGYRFAVMQPIFFFDHCSKFPVAVLQHDPIYHIFPIDGPPTDLRPIFEKIISQVPIKLVQHIKIFVVALSGVGFCVDAKAIQITSHSHGAFLMPCALVLLGITGF